MTTLQLALVRVLFGMVVAVSLVGCNNVSSFQSPSLGGGGGDDEDGDNDPAPSGDGIELDLSYVDANSNQYTRFKAHVDAGVTGAHDEGWATDAAFMYRITGTASYCASAIARVDQQVTQDEANIASQGSVYIARDSYLYFGPIMLNLSIVYDWCASQMTNVQRTRWAAYADEAVWNLWNCSSADWGGTSRPWSCWSVENAGNNYYFSFVEGTIAWALASGRVDLMALLSGAGLWGRTARLPKFDAYYTSLGGGGSREGTGYGTAHMHLFSIYSLWKDAAGVDLSDNNDHLDDSIRYWINATVPTLDRFAPIGDQSRDTEANLYDYHRRLMLEARHLTSSNTLKNLASWWLNNISVTQMAQRLNRRYDLLPAGSVMNHPGGESLTYHATGTGHVFSRSNWTKDARWLSFVAGPYSESHAHQDQGSFSLFSGAADPSTLRSSGYGWLAVTSNMFSHSGIRQETDGHNVVRFIRGGVSLRQYSHDLLEANDFEAVPGETSSLSVTPGANGEFEAVANLTNAYKTNAATPSAHVLNWERALDWFVTPGVPTSRTLRVVDDISVSAGTETVFQVNTPAFWNNNGTPGNTADDILLTPVVDVGARTVTYGRMTITVVSPANATIQVLNWDTDINLDGENYDPAFRIEIRNPSNDGFTVDLRTD